MPVFSSGISPSPGAGCSQDESVLNGSEVRTNLILSFRDFFGQGRRTDTGTDMVPLEPPPAPKPTPQVPPGGSVEYHLLPAGGCLFRYADAAISASENTKASPSGIAVSWYGIRGSRVVHGGSSRILQNWVACALCIVSPSAEVGTVKYLLVRS